MTLEAIRRAVQEWRLISDDPKYPLKCAKCGEWIEVERGGLPRSASGRTHCWVGEWCYHKESRKGMHEECFAKYMRELDTVQFWQCEVLVEEGDLLPGGGTWVWNGFEAEVDTWVSCVVMVSAWDLEHCSERKSHPQGWADFCGHKIRFLELVASYPGVEFQTVRESRQTFNAFRSQHGCTFHAHTDRRILPANERWIGMKPKRK